MFRKSLRPAPQFCQKCGAELVVRMRRYWFDRATGKPMGYKVLECVKATGEGDNEPNGHDVWHSETLREKGYAAPAGL